MIFREGVDMYPYISFFKLQVPAYGLMLTLGILVANGCAYATCRREKIADWQLLVPEGYGALGGMLGAKLLYLMVSWDKIEWSRWREPDFFNSLMSGGFVFYGGLIGGLFACLLAGRIHNIPVPAIASRVIYALPLAHGFGRTGCLLAGCCYGMPYEGPFAVSYPEAKFGQCVGCTYFPIQAVEAVCLWLLAFLVWRLSRKKRGLQPIFAYLLGYGAMRFVLEFFRGDSARGHLGCLSVSQIISLLLIALAGALFLFFPQKDSP